MHSESSTNNSSIDKITFWQKQRKGANIFNVAIDKSLIEKAKEYNINFIRLAPDKFRTKNRDFLMVNADDYQAIDKEDLIKLKDIISQFSTQNIPVVITFLSLPGSRWKQNNGGKDDLRIWRSKKYQEQAAKFWRDVALELKGQPNIVGYNILNEPHLERLWAKNNEAKLYSINQSEVQKVLNDFYKKVISAIREVDLDTPIILDSSAHADPRTFAELMHINGDDKIIYSFHMYEPFNYTNKKINKGQYTYPGYISNEGERSYFDKNKLNEMFDAVRKFQIKNNIPKNRILVGEFGAHRTASGIEKYFQDLISIFNVEQWHYAMYAFREDSWDGMNYELGAKRLPLSYWESVKKGEDPKMPYHHNSIFELFLQEWQKTIVDATLESSESHP